MLRCKYALSFLLFILPLASNASPAETDKVLRKLEVFAKVLSYVEGNYVKQVKPESLIYNAIDGLLSELDPHTMFLRPDVYRSMKEDTFGEYGGIGLELSVRENSIVIIAAIEDSPAQRAKIKSGDEILMIDNVTVTRQTNIVELTDQLKGPVGTKVTIVIKEKDTGLMREVTLKRELVKIQSVTANLVEKKFGYLKVKSFQDRTSADFKKELRILETEAKGLEGFILDLRNNPGGLLEEAIELADLFLDTGIIVSTKGRKGAFGEVRHAHAQGTLARKPMVLMVNEGSASASEIVASALQDHKRALILGSPTFGKGSVQTIIDLDDGSALKLTVAKYYRPKGGDLQAMGITPDVIVEPFGQDLQTSIKDTPLREVDLLHHLEGAGESKPKKTAPKNGEPNLKADNQLRSAVYHLKTWNIFRGILP